MLILRNKVAKKADEAEAIIPKKEEMGDEIGSLAADVKRRILAKDPDVDTTFGIYYSPSGGAYIGNKPVTIQGDDIGSGTQGKSTLDLGHLSQPRTELKG